MGGIVDHFETIGKWQKGEIDKQGVDKQIDVLKASLRVQYDWPALVQYAPAALACIGVCDVAASSNNGSNSLQRQDRGLKHMRSDTLGQGLSEIKNSGVDAIGRTNSAMDYIASATTYDLVRPVRAILDTPSQLTNDLEGLEEKFVRVREAAEECHRHISEAADQYDGWIFRICELHAACVAREPTPEDIETSLRLCTIAELGKKTADDDRKIGSSIDVLTKQLRLLSESFRKASKQYPPDMKNVEDRRLADRMVGDFTDAAAGALDAAILDIVKAVAPHSTRIFSGSDVVGSFLHKGDRTAEITSEMGRSIRNIYLRKTRHPLVMSLRKDMTYVEVLADIVNGPDENINWEKIKLANNQWKLEETNIMTFLAWTFDLANQPQSTFPDKTFPDNGDDDALKAKAIYTDLARITNQIAKIVVSTRDSRRPWPAATENNVKEWRSSFQKTYEAAWALVSKVEIAQGASRHGQVVTGTQSNSKPDDIPYQGRAILKRDFNYLSIKHKTRVVSKDVYDKVNEQCRDRQSRTAEVNDVVEHLITSQFNMLELKHTLAYTLKMAIEMKCRVTEMADAFHALAIVLVRFGEIYLEPIRGDLQYEKEWPARVAEIHYFGLLDLHRTNVYTAAITLHAYFSILGENARMWQGGHEDRLTAAFELCDGRVPENNGWTDDRDTVDPLADRYPELREDDDGHGGDTGNEQPPEDDDDDDDGSGEPPEDDGADEPPVEEGPLDPSGGDEPTSPPDNAEEESKPIIQYWREWFPKARESVQKDIDMQSKKNMQTAAEHIEEVGRLIKDFPDTPASQAILSAKESVMRDFAEALAIKKKNEDFLWSA